MFWNAISAVIMVLVIVAVGYFVGYSGRKQAAIKLVTEFITWLIVTVTLPCTVVNTFYTSFTAQSLTGSVDLIIAAFIGVFSTYVVAKIVTRFAKIEKGQRGVFAALFGFSNSVFVGLPVAQAIFGDRGMAFAVLYFLANTTLMNSFSYADIRADGAYLQGKEYKKSTPWQTIRRLIKPPLVAVIIGFVLVLTGLRLPDFLATAVSYIGNITSPLALIFLGMILYRNRDGLKSFKAFDKKMALVSIGRFIIAPLLMWSICLLMGIPAYPTAVLIVQTSLPAMVQVTVYAEAFKADSELAAKGVIITLLVSFVALPLYVLMFGSL